MAARVQQERIVEVVGAVARGRESVGGFMLLNCLPRLRFLRVLEALEALAPVRLTLMAAMAAVERIPRLVLTFVLPADLVEKAVEMTVLLILELEELLFMQVVAGSEVESVIRCPQPRPTPLRMAQVVAAVAAGSRLPRCLPQGLPALLGLGLRTGSRAGWVVRLALTGLGQSRPVTFWAQFQAVQAVAARRWQEMPDGVARDLTDSDFLGLLMERVPEAAEVAVALMATVPVKADMELAAASS